MKILIFYFSNKKYTFILYINLILKLKSLLNIKLKGRLFGIKNKKRSLIKAKLNDFIYCKLFRFKYEKKRIKIKIF